jgi:hypothetical protein
MASLMGHIQRLPGVVISIEQLSACDGVINYNILLTVIDTWFCENYHEIWARDFDGKTIRKRTMAVA